ncbi:MAG: hypothetical protein HYU66_23670 [Armatimonadetes bacterium]|nr:hypothetical protein [Armatimonadota bacterium]
MASEPRGSPVSLRSVLLGLALIPVNVWWLIQIEYVRYSDTPTIPQLFYHAVAVLTLLTLANAAVARRCPRHALSRGELLTVYAMLVMASNVAGHDQLQILFTTICWLYARATPENQWAESIFPHLPRRLVVTDQKALDDLFRGYNDRYLADHWQAWAAPLAVWTVVAALVAWTLFCVAALLRRQWDNERLTYPLADVPLAVTETGLPLFRSWAFWVGFAPAAGLQLLNLCHQIWPGVPGINIGVWHVNPQVGLWRYLGTIPICFYPFAFGVSFLLPTNLAFSCWFFFLVTRLEKVVAAYFGFTEWEGFPYVNEQATGAFIGFGLFALYAARAHLRATLRIALRAEHGEDAGEPLSYRTAWLGFALGGVALIGFSMAAGLRLWTALAYWLMLLGIILAVARIRAEVGLPSIELYQRGSDDLLRRVFGTAAFRPSELVVFTLFFWLNRTHRNYNLQHEFHGLRLASRTGLELRGFGGALLLAAGVGIVVGLLAMLQVSSQVGLAGGRFTGPAGWAFGNDPWQKLGRHLLIPQPPETAGRWAYLVGMGICALLVWARAKLVWWPLHPAGWVAGNSFALLRLWVPLTLTWAIKSLLLRYGGLKGYLRALPFFLGLAVGEFSAGLLRTVIDLAWGLYLPANSGIGGL